MELKRLNELQKMNKTSLVNLFLSLQEFTRTTLLENNDLKEVLEIRQKLDFASTTEKLSYLQMLFDELDVEKDAPAEEQEQKEVTVREHTRRAPYTLLTLPAETPVIDIYHEATVPTCPVCEGTAMVKVEDKIVDRIGTAPSKRYIERHHYAQFACRECEADWEAGEKNRVTVNYRPEIDNLMAAPSLVADSVVQKFADGLPLYRQTGIFKRNGMEISRQTLSNWLLSYWQLLPPLIKRFKLQLIQANLINQDETPIKVLKPAPKGTSQSNFMVVQVGSSGNHRIVLFTYVSNRRRLTLDSLVAGYQNYIQTDGLKEYNHLENHIGCWVHGVRDFKKILKVNPGAANAKAICKIVGKLYTIEDEERERAAKEGSDTAQFMASRKQRAEAVFDELEDFLHTIRGDYTSGSAMGKAMNYLYNHWNQLIEYVNCYEATPSNNIAENAIRPFVCGRKAWLFANTVNGADASALYYSLIETAKANGLNPYEYIWYVLEQARTCRNEDDWDRLLPWNIDTSYIAMLKGRRDSAFPNPNRKEPYIFRGKH